MGIAILHQKCNFYVWLEVIFIAQLFSKFW